MTYGAPRTLLFVTVKRDNPSWRDLYGHWWVEIGGEESYGWWPARVPLGVRELLRGCGGALNGMGLVGRGATWFRDSAHGRDAAHAFHPVLGDPVSDDEVRRRMRHFAHSYAGTWRWAWRPGGKRDSCRSFQDDLLAAAGLVEGAEHLATRGQGCPFLYRPRTLLWATQDGMESLHRQVRTRRTGRNAYNSPAARGAAREQGSGDETFLPDTSGLCALTVVRTGLYVGYEPDDRTAPPPDARPAR